MFRLSDAGDKAAMGALLAEKPYIKVHDTLDAQLRELVKLSHPTETLSARQIDELMAERFGKTAMDEYGVWVYYPWAERLVHIVDEEEFILLRTSRNRYKITEEEQQQLYTKKIGVVGLSVGQSVSLTMAIERTFGELRIADFDELEITNLNRLRSGIHNMGLKKAVIVAREIAEIDPYLKVVPFLDGLTAENMDEFFTGGGNLDLVIDECDGLDIKILLRHKAKAMHIPVLMEASDRGTIDIERFDLEPNRPLLHGFIDHLDHTKIGSLTNEQKLPYILPMLGIETISKRLKASMAEIKQTITTWPQLASAVALGGALCADVCRRVLLGTYKGSGRYFVDIEEQICDDPHKLEGEYKASPYTYPELTTEQMQGLAAAAPGKPSAISREHMQAIVEAAIQAPSAGNNQPWKLLSKDGVLYLFHDKAQSYSWTDEEDFIAQIALGAALQNIEVQAAGLGYAIAYEVFPLGTGEPLIAAVSFSAAKITNDKGLDALIGMRCTNRKKGDNELIPADVLKSIGAAVQVAPSASASFVTSKEDIAAVAAIESAAERIRFLHPQSHFEFFSKELKWNETGKEVIYEGLDIKTLEMTLSNETGMKVASDPGVIALLNKWKLGKAFEKPAREAILTSSAIGLITMPEYSAESYVHGGRAMEQVWLTATAHNLAFHPISAPLFLHARLKYGSTAGVENYMVEEVDELYRKLCILFPELDKRLGVFLFRLSQASAPTARSLRKPSGELFKEI